MLIPHTLGEFWNEVKVRWFWNCFCGYWVSIGWTSLLEWGREGHLRAPFPPYEILNYVYTFQEEILCMSMCGCKVGGHRKWVDIESGWKLVELLLIHVCVWCQCHWSVTFQWHIGLTVYMYHFNLLYFIRRGFYTRRHNPQVVGVRSELRKRKMEAYVATLYVHLQG